MPLLEIQQCGFLFTRVNSSPCYGLMLTSDWWSVVIAFTAFMIYGLVNVGAIHAG